MGVTERTVEAGTPVADPRTAAAASALTQAVHRLRTIRRNALGGNYDQPTFDQAVLACRLADSAVRAARQEVDAARAAARVPGGDALPALPSTSEPIRPRPLAGAGRPAPAAVSAR